MNYVPDKLYLIVNSYDPTTKTIHFSIAKNLRNSLKLTTTKKDGTVAEDYIPIENVINELKYAKENIEVLDYYDTNKMEINNAVNTYAATLTQNTEFVFDELDQGKKCTFDLIIDNPDEYTITFPSNVVNITTFTNTNISETKYILKFVGANISGTTEWYITV